VVPERFLDDKVLVTGWLLEKLGADKVLPFRLHRHNKEFVDFIKNSKEISHLYDEMTYIAERDTRGHKPFGRYDVLWNSLHMGGECRYAARHVSAFLVPSLQNDRSISNHSKSFATIMIICFKKICIGAISFVTLVTTSVCLNDMAEEKVAWITGIMFLLFSLLGYLTGDYLYVIRPLRCWILLWNPFVREPHFMLKLQRVSVVVVSVHISFLACCLSLTFYIPLLTPDMS
jgi:hypothetical protein